MKETLSIIVTVTLLVVLSNLALLSGATSLVSFRSCTDLRSYFRKNGVSRVGSYGFGGRRVFGPVFNTFAESDSSAQKRPTQGIDFSGTNVQVEGVDEPDIVKTDGTRIFTIRGNNFFVVQVTSGGKSGRVLGNITLPIYPQEMLFHQDDVLVIGTKYNSYTLPEPLPVVRSTIIPYGSITTILYRVSVKEREPKIVETLEIQGSYISGRSVDGVARIVMSFNAFPEFRFRSPSGTFTAEKSKKYNQELLSHSTEKGWLPTYSLTGERCSRYHCSKYSYKNRQLLSCSSVYFPKDEFSGFNILSVVTIKINGPIIPTAVGIVADGQTIYATASALYVATTKYEFDARQSPDQERVSGSSFTTSFHKFGLYSYGARYVASGAVSGSVLNQFSMHEYRNTFFIATTDGAPWWGQRDTSSSKISALELSVRHSGPASLQVVGVVGNLGLGERIYAVRYIGAVAYVVTFKQVDPLYIIDLTNSRKPRVTGELKIPGYSAYLHVVGDGRLLGVGRDVTLEGRTTGAKVSLFDVSDVSSPKELSTWTLEGSYTTAEWDHRAFLYWAPEKAAVLPISLYSPIQKDRFTGSIVLTVSDSKIVEKGRITHTCCGNEWERAIQRNFILGRTHLWSLSYRALQANDVKTLAFESSTPLLYA